MSHKRKMSEEELKAWQNIYAVMVMVGILLFAGALNKLTAVIAAVLIAAGVVGVSICDKELEKLQKEEDES